MRQRLVSWYRTAVGRRARRLLVLGTALVGLGVAGGVYLAARADVAPKSPAGAGKVIDDNNVELSDSQLQFVEVGSVVERAFPLESEAVGSIDFNEDLATPVYPPYQGRIVTLTAKLGDSVSLGQTLFTIESPDLIQAESTLIASAGVLELTSNALQRAKELFRVEGIAEKDLQQAASDQQSAEGALRAARNAVEVFGKKPGEIDRMIETRRIDPHLVVPSPISGRVTARNAAPGMFVQPGSAPAPYSVADLSRVWLNASVTESDMPLMRRGQKVEASVMAYPGRAFTGVVSAVGAAVDPQLHRGMIRAELGDPHHELLPGMFASFLISTGEPVTSTAVPVDATIREGDGTMTVWIAVDQHRFARRIVKIGRQHQGYDQVLEGVRPGEKVVRKGAILLDNLVGGGLS